MPLASESLVKKHEGFKSSQTISTIRSPHSEAIRTWFASIAGMLLAPGNVNPIASTIDVMVLAVPIVLQVPGERVILASSLIHSGCLILPATYSSQNFLVWVPAPTLCPL